MDPSRRRRTARRLWTAVVASLALPFAMLSTLPTPAQAAALQCSVDYKTNDWGSGFTADVTLTNRGTDAISGWSLTYSYAGNQKLSNGWNGSWTQSGQQIKVNNASFNATIAHAARRSARGPSSPTAARTPLPRASRSTARPVSARTSRRSPC